MKLNDLIKKTYNLNEPFKILLHGKHGMGKSTFASKAPSPIFLPFENGLERIDTQAFPLVDNLIKLEQSLELLLKEKHDYKTIVFDTLDGFERVVWDDICSKNNVKNIEEIGYRKGYIFALSPCQKIMQRLEELQAKKKMNILLIAHTQQKMMTPPQGQPYDSYIIKLHHKMSSFFQEQVNAVYFLNEKVFVTKKGGKGQGISGGRVLQTKPDPAWEAKDRYQISSEIEIPETFDFQVLLDQIYKTK